MPLQRDLNGMRAYKFMYDSARQNIGYMQGYGQYFGGPMTVEEQCVSKRRTLLAPWLTRTRCRFLADMVSTTDAFIAEPSKEGVRRWKTLANGYVPEFLSIDEKQRVDELLEEHRSVGDYFHRLCEYLGP